MRKHRSGVLGAILVALALIAAACGSGEDATTDGPTITIGSANFSENALVAEIYAQVLEGEGYSVERNLNIGAREVYTPALESGELDLVPEYVGSALGYRKTTPPTADSSATLQALQEALADSGLAALDTAPAEDKNGIVVRQDTADSLGLSKVSDLAAHTDLIFGGPPECPERDFCLIGLTDVYGLSFAEFKPLDGGGPLTVAALEEDAIQVGLLFTSDGVIAAKGFVLLEDDKGLQPAENLTPVIRQEIIDAYGDNLVDALNKVSGELTTAELSEMNRRIGIDGDDPEQVATDWIADNL
ncbi:MAG: ABC transporter substrate-binding protein [bacterium]|nr:ABC transporter substrate-binding protein [bacterium]